MGKPLTAEEEAKVASWVKQAADHCDQHRSPLNFIFSDHDEASLDAQDEFVRRLRTAGLAVEVSRGGSTVSVRRPAA